MKIIYEHAAFKQRSKRISSIFLLPPVSLATAAILSAFALVQMSSQVMPHFFDIPVGRWRLHQFQDISQERDLLIFTFNRDIWWKMWIIFETNRACSEQQCINLLLSFYQKVFSVNHVSVRKMHMHTRHISVHYTGTHTHTHKIGWADPLLRVCVNLPLLPRHTT